MPELRTAIARSRRARRMNNGLEGVVAATRLSHTDGDTARSGCAHTVSDLSRTRLRGTVAIIWKALRARASPAQDPERVRIAEQALPR